MIPSGQRHHWMDALRGAAVLLVALWHAFSIPYRETPPGIEWAFDFLSVYRIPLLMFLSGLLLDHSLSKPVSAYVGGKLRRIAWPLLVWSLVLILIAWRAAKPDSVGFWFGEDSHLWYLGVLLVCYAIGFLTRWVHPVVFLIVGVPAMELVQTENWLINSTLWFGLFFFAGATMSRWLAWWLARGPVLPSIALLAASAWAAYSATVHGYAPVAHWRPLAFSLAGVIGLVWFAARMRRARWLEWVGQRSIVFYVAHVPFIWIVTVLAVGSLPPPVTYALVLVVTGAGCWMLARHLAGSILFVFPRLPVRRRPEAAGEPLATPPGS
ncbi:acyltransferase family protein [Agromyces aurantiacus]|uniref:Acyltransferase family protein n=1 Tax=Agromyces aurantiacus TaxID=165814 RepID=A0ABV9R967_9MICO|nr:acyltransferase [Agromyces aurantiacus]MBM7504968.1 fucose 4-O-acetylase-like acetyltransferase [Agromyces aurantiacus]